MNSSRQRLEAFLNAAPAVALVEVAGAKGSTPREKGAWMLVSPEAIFGTIGGGQLEFMAIAKAREMLALPTSPSPLWGGWPEGPGGGDDGVSDPAEPSPSSASRIDPPHKGEGWAASSMPDPSLRLRGEGAQRADEGQRNGCQVLLDIPLGPEIGQCCGGRVNLSIRVVDGKLREELQERGKKQDDARPQVLIFGGGHVGHALAAALSLLPVQAMVIETRVEALEGMPHDVETRLTPVPEEMVREAPPGSAFVVLTHDHALDFLIVAEALKRDDAAYVGMIGSRTKKATFRNWFLKTAGGSQEAYARLVSPIGGAAVKDKRPAVIAALAAAEIMTALTSYPSSKSPGSAAGSARP